MHGNCKHDNVSWVSGVEGLVIPINGKVVAECLTCGMVATLEENND